MRVKFMLQKRPETTEEKLKRLEEAHEKQAEDHALEVADLKEKLDTAAKDLETLKTTVTRHETDLSGLKEAKAGTK